MDENEVLKNIGNRLVRLRKQKGYSSYEQFAFEHQLSRQQYWRMEQGANITIKSLLKVLEVHALTIEAFFLLPPTEDLPE